MEESWDNVVKGHFSWGTAPGKDPHIHVLDSRMTNFKMGSVGGVVNEIAGKNFSSKFYYDEWYQELLEWRGETSGLGYILWYWYYTMIKFGIFWIGISPHVFLRFYRWLTCQEKPWRVTQLHVTTHRVESVTRTYWNPFHYRDERNQKYLGAYNGMTLLRDVTCQRIYEDFHDCIAFLVPVSFYVPIAVMIAAIFAFFGSPDGSGGLGIVSLVFCLFNLLVTLIILMEKILMFYQKFQGFSSFFYGLKMMILNKIAPKIFKEYAAPVLEPQNMIESDYYFWRHFNVGKLIGFVIFACLSVVCLTIAFIAAFSKGIVAQGFYIAGAIFWYLCVLTYPTRTFAEHAHMNLEFDNGSMPLILELTVALNLESHLLWKRDDVSFYKRNTSDQTGSLPMFRKYLEESYEKMEQVEEVKVDVSGNLGSNTTPTLRKYRQKDSNENMEEQDVNVSESVNIEVKQQ